MFENHQQYVMFVIEMLHVPYLLRCGLKFYSRDIRYYSEVRENL